ncbi:MAG: hypothetical protein KUG79_08615 [Pseudomonadales bacterium]|nr:hypothetical protein [Pseudomonadales bacterium]
MAFFDISDNELHEIPSTTFAKANVSERDDLQQLLRRNVEVISPDTLVISEEFSNWADSRRRIDLLGVDKDANLVVIELKRTEDGGHMELQALRYAAMVSPMTLDQAIDVYQKYLTDNESDLDARQSLLDFLEWDEEEENEFAQEVRIVLASAEFSKEITTTVLWLNSLGHDISCVRLRPYKDGKRTLIDINQLIPLPEAKSYQVQMKEKNQREQATRRNKRDYTKFDVTVNDSTQTDLAKRRAALAVVKGLITAGVDPVDIANTLSWRKTFCIFNGECTPDDVTKELSIKEKDEGPSFAEQNWFAKENEIIHHNGKTYVLSSKWGPRTEKALKELINEFSERGVSYRKANAATH